MLSELRDGEKIIGVKQSSKAIKGGRACVVYIAEDAAERITGPVTALCKQTGTKIVMVPTMKQLGEACGIEVGSAVAVLLN